MAEPAASGAEESPSDTIKLTLRLTTHPVNAVPSNHPLTLPRTATVLEVKTKLSQEWDGKPQADGITCVKGGRVCRDAEIVGELFGRETSERDTVLHVIVRPSAWTEPFASRPAPTPTIPAAAEMASPIVSSGTAIASTPASAPGGPNLIAKPVASAPSLPQLEPTPTPTTTHDATPTPTPALDAAANSTTPPSDTPVAPANAPLYSTFLAYLAQLIPLQRSVLLLNLQKAHSLYAKRVQVRRATLASNTGGSASSDAAQNDSVDESEVEEIKQLLIECKLWDSVVGQEVEAEREAQAWQEQGRGPAQQQEFQVVQINGLPFLLHVPQGLDESHSPAPSVARYKSLRRAEAILRTLTTMLQLLITYQPTAPSIAYGRALLSPSAGPGGANVIAVNPAVALGPAGVLLPPPGLIPPGAIPRRRATLSIVINLEAILSIIVPLLLLSLKLGFLLWIFGRHASHTKRLVLGGMAATWVLWEGYGMYRRRAAVGHARDRLERAQRRAQAMAAAGLGPGAAAAAAGAVPPAQPAVRPRRQGEPGLRQRAVAGGEAPGRLAPGQAAAGADAAPPVPREGRAHRQPGTGRPRREAPSRLSPRYWIAWIATIGLVEEAHELGLAPRTVAGRHVPYPTRPPPHLPARHDRIGRAAYARRKAFRTALIAFVLFFGTLVPEVERKRKRALEKRDRLLAEKRVQREREIERQRAEAEAATATAAHAPTASTSAGTSNGLPPPASTTPRAVDVERQLSDGPTTGASTPAMTFEGSPPPVGPASHSASSSTTEAQVDDTPPALAPVADPALAVTTPPAQTALGRGRVTDAELFADGLGEPDQDHTSQAEAAERNADQGLVEVGESSEDDDDEPAHGDADDDVDQVVALF